MKPIQQVELQPAFILHAKPFRETSLLLEIFCRDYGRVSLVARGARKVSKNQCGFIGQHRPRFRSALQPFISLLLSWRGRGDLFNLTYAESNAIGLQITGSLLPGGWYMNELLVRTLRHWDAHTSLFIDYQRALPELKNNLSLNLRKFEKSLLLALGVMPQLDCEVVTGLPVRKEKYYWFSPLSGVSSTPFEANDVCRFRGDILLAVQHDDWRKSERWPHMRRLFRLMLDSVLGEKAVRSRDLLQCP